jgi:SAM-dependent methyltransferase
LSGYIYDPAYAQERERLAGIEGQWDPGTIRHLEALGVDEGSRCLAVGAGGGSIVGWLAQRVGSRGRVLATDLDTRYLEAIESPNLEVRRHDILVDRLPDERFDLVQARMVVEHLADPERAIERMVAMLEPGGWLLLEDFDWITVIADPPAPGLERLAEGIRHVMSTLSPYDPDCGRKLPGHLRAAGLIDIGAEGRCHPMGPGHPGHTFVVHSTESLRPALLASTELTDEHIDAALAELSDPSRTLISTLQLAAWGRKPQEA